MKFCPGWKFGSLVDCWMNVLVNTLVVIPFMAQTEAIQVIKEKKKNPLNQTQTKGEYFWLFLFVVVENIIALFIELGNGGVWTSQGHHYSWDIRIITLLLSLVILLVYNKKYHIT